MESITLYCVNTGSLIQNPIGGVNVSSGGPGCAGTLPPRHAAALGARPPSVGWVVNFHASCVRAFAQHLPAGAGTPTGRPPGGRARAHDGAGATAGRSGLGGAVRRRARAVAGKGRGVALPSPYINGRRRRRSGAERAHSLGSLWQL
eukprot:scaffold2959_cov388-Prasinococcus_capsulatus_cf.AAC.5